MSDVSIPPDLMKFLFLTKKYSGGQLYNSAIPARLKNACTE